MLSAPPRHSSEGKKYLFMIEIPRTVSFVQSRMKLPHSEEKSVQRYVMEACIRGLRSGTEI